MLSKPEYIKPDYITLEQVILYATHDQKPGSTVYYKKFKIINYTEFLSEEETRRYNAQQEQMRLFEHYFNTYAFKPADYNIDYDNIKILGIDIDPLLEKIPSLDFFVNWEDINNPEICNDNDILPNHLIHQFESILEVRYNFAKNYIHFYMHENAIKHFDSDDLNLLQNTLVNRSYENVRLNTNKFYDFVRSIKKYTKEAKKLQNISRKVGRSKNEYLDEIQSLYLSSDFQSMIVGLTSKRAIAQNLINHFNSQKNIPIEKLPSTDSIRKDYLDSWKQLLKK